MGTETAPALANVQSAWISSIEDPDMKRAFGALFNGGMSQYFADIAKNWQTTSSKALGDVAEKKLGTGGLNANSAGNELNTHAPQKVVEAYDPGVATQRGSPS